MTAQDVVQFWKEGSEEAWKTVEALIQTKRYLHALFFVIFLLKSSSEWTKKANNLRQFLTTYAQTR